MFKKVTPIKMIPKLKPPFNKGDVITYWDSLLKRTITGYIVDVVLAYDGIYDLTIRWNDLFVSLERCSVPQAKKRIKQGMWKYFPLAMNRKYKNRMKK